jgi:hypothetical protein
MWQVSELWVQLAAACHSHPTTVFDVIQPAVCVYIRKAFHAMTLVFYRHVTIACLRYVAENGNWTCRPVTICCHHTEALNPAGDFSNLRHLVSIATSYAELQALKTLFGFYGNSRFQTAYTLDITWFLWQHHIPNSIHFRHYLVSMATSYSKQHTF